MHEEYDNYDDDYDDSQDNLEDKYKHYFKFDPEAWDAWGKMLYDTLNDIVENSPNVWYIGADFGKKSFPVSSYFSNTGKDKTFQYLGSNYQNSQVWKNKYFVYNPIQHQYINHIQSHAVHFIQQPHYYKGLFDILN
jgi:hypothetical protein